MSKHNQSIDDLPETEEKSWKQTVQQILRLKALLVTVALVGIFGWIWLDEYIAPAFMRLWVDLVKLWDEATLTAILRGIAAYISRFGWRLILIETLKRVLIWLAITKLIVWLMPWESRLAWRWWMQEKKESLFGKIKRARAFLSRPDMFGPFFGIALWVILTGVVLVLFYSFFWLWTMIVLGFIKLPGVINRFFSFVWSKISWAMQKSRFMKLLGRVFKEVYRRVWKYVTTPLVRLFPSWHILKRDEESLRKRRIDQIREMRVLIRMRKNKELWWQARGKRHVYRQLREEHGHDVHWTEVLPQWLQKLLRGKKPNESAETDVQSMPPQIKQTVMRPCCLSQHSADDKNS